MANKIKCTCGHSWNKSDSSKKDMHICHICGKDNTMKNGGWLDKFDAPQAQNGIEGTMGGLTDKGFNFNPAWGGAWRDGGILQPPMAGANQTVPMAQKGTRQPIYTSDLQDPRLRAYNDSLYSYNTTKQYEGRFPVVSNIIADRITGLRTTPNPMGHMSIGWYEKPSDDINTDASSFSPKYKKPVQPVVYKKPNYWTKKDVDKSFWASFMKKHPGAIGVDPFHVDRDNYHLPIYPENKKEPKQKLVTRFQKFDDLDVNIPNIELTDVRPAIAQPTFEQARVDMSKPTKYSYTYPTFDKDVQKTMYFPDRSSWKTFVEQQRGASSQEGKGYGSATGQFAMGGSLPGSVGFTYARVSGAAPSEGPYAKKTLPSAQQGKAIDANKEFLKDWYSNRKITDQYIQSAFNLDKPAYQKNLQNFPKIQEVRPPMLPIDPDPSVSGRFNHATNQIQVNAGAPSYVRTHELNHFMNSGGAGEYMRGIHKEIVGNELLPQSQMQGVYKDKYDYLSDPDEVHSRIMVLREKAGLKPNETVTPEKLKGFMKTYKGDVDNINTLLNMSKGEEGLLNMLNFMAKGKSSTPTTAQNGAEMKFYQEGLDWTPKNISRNGGWLDKFEEGGEIVKDDEGYWNSMNWGKPVEIGSNEITMEGVNEPLLGVSDTGDIQMMYPGKNYTFSGKKVVEYPREYFTARDGKSVNGQHSVAQRGTQVSSVRTSGPVKPTGRETVYVSNPNDPRLKSYEDSLYNYNVGRRLSGILDADKNLVKVKPGSPYDKALQAGLKASDYNLRDNTKEDTGGYENYERVASVMREYQKKGNRGILPIRFQGYFPDPDNTVVDLITLRSFWDAIGVTNPRPPGAAHLPEWKKPEQQVVFDPNKTPKKTTPKPITPVRKEKPKVQTKKEQPPVQTTTPITTAKVPVKPVSQTTGPSEMFKNPKAELLVDNLGNYEWFRTDDDREDLKPIRRATREEIEYSKKQKQRNGGVSVNKADEYPLEKLDNLLNFTNYNKPKAKNGWLEKYK